MAGAVGLDQGDAFSYVSGMNAEHESRKQRAPQLRVAELFAGVGGFRLGLEASSGAFRTTFSSQWEPPGSAAKQFASACYVEHFGAEGHYNQDIALVLDQAEQRLIEIGPLDVVVGGFPCQDYSVAKPLNQSQGLRGKKGVLWWQIHRLISLTGLHHQYPRYVFLENVDRLLKSPGSQRGRDFAIMLASLSDLGYDVEWRVINAADYGFSQRRRRVLIVARRRECRVSDGCDTVFKHGVLARAFPVQDSASIADSDRGQFELIGEIHDISNAFGLGLTRSPFLNAGVVQGRKVLTYKTSPSYYGPKMTLGDILIADEDVSEELLITPEAFEKWRYLKGSKNEPRLHKASGTTYQYTEGPLPFPDSLERASRTILTAEGGKSPSRFKHVVQMGNGRFRRLSAIELERLNDFPDDWTNFGMSDVKRAFCMGNALVVGLVERVSRIIAKDESLETNPACMIAVDPADGRASR